MTASEIDGLLCRIAVGDNNAFESLYIGTKRGIYSFLYSYCRNTDDTEDCLQTTFLRIKLYINSYKCGTNGRSWILQIAKNVAFDFKKKKQETYSLDEPEALAQSHEEHPNTRLHLTEIILRTLTEEEARIVMLHVLGGYRHREIAELIELPLGTVTSKYKRSLKKLKDAMKEDA